MQMGLSWILLGPAGRDAARRLLVATSGRAPSPTGSTSPSPCSPSPSGGRSACRSGRTSRCRSASPLLVFALFAIAFALGAMGGGDVKLVAALALWLPWQAVLVAARHHVARRRRC